MNCAREQDPPDDHHRPDLNMEKLLLPIALVALAPSGAAPEPSVRSMLDPRGFSNPDLLVVVEYEGEEAILWNMDDAEVEEVRTDSGELLEPSFFSPALVMPGDRDPRISGYTPLAEGSQLVVFEFDAPEEEWKSIPRLAGSYELLHGGELHWVELPFEEVHESEPWEDEALAEAGFEFEYEVKLVPQLHIKCAGEHMDIDEVVLVDGEGVEHGEKRHRLQRLDDLYDNRGGMQENTQGVYEFDLEGIELEGLVALVRMEDESTIELDDLPERDTYRALRNRDLRDAGLELEVRRVEVREFSAQGAGNYESLMDFRWLDKRDEELHIFSHWSKSDFRGATLSARIPYELPRGAHLQLGVVSGATLERVSFEHLDIDAPD